MHPGGPGRADMRYTPSSLRLVRPLRGFRRNFVHKAIARGGRSWGRADMRYAPSSLRLVRPLREFRRNSVYKTTAPIDGRGGGAIT